MKPLIGIPMDLVPDIDNKLASGKPARRTTIRRCGRTTKPSPFMSSQAMGA